MITILLYDRSTLRSYHSYTIAYNRVPMITYIKRTLSLSLEIRLQWKPNDKLYYTTILLRLIRVKIELYYNYNGVPMIRDTCIIRCYTIYYILCFALKIK